MLVTGADQRLRSAGRRHGSSLGSGRRGRSAAVLRTQARSPRRHR